MSATLSAITWLLIPMGLLPVISAIVLLPHINADSLALKERARLAQILAFLGASASLLALYVLFEWGGAWIWVLFGIGLIGVDIASGIWLYQYIRGRFRSPD